MARTRPNMAPTLPNTAHAHPNTARVSMRRPLDPQAHVHAHAHPSRCSSTTLMWRTPALNTAGTCRCSSSCCGGARRRCSTTW
eukprot:3999221-Prymnesium_polylepis.2